MKLTKRYYAFLFGFISSVVAANQPTIASSSTPLTNPPFFSPFVITLSVGPQWANGGDTQTFYLARELDKTYKADSSIQTLAYGDLFLGLQR